MSKRNLYLTKSTKDGETYEGIHICIYGDDYLLIPLCECRNPKIVPIDKETLRKVETCPRK